MNQKTTPDRAEEAGSCARFLSYVALCALSVFMVISSLEIPASRFAKIGAGAYPALVFSLLGLLSLIAAVTAVRTLPAGAFGRLGAATAAWLRARHLVVAVFLCLGAYLLLMPVLGYDISTFLFLIATQALLAPRTRKAMILSLVIAVAFSFGLDLLFDHVFYVYLPGRG